MTVVLADPEGFAVDWNWQRHLTVWALTGRTYEPQFDSKVLEHELRVQPTSQRQAHAAARSWWRARAAPRRSPRSGRAPASRSDDLSDAAGQRTRG